MTNTHQQKIQRNIAGTQMNKEAVLQLILRGKLKLARGIACTDVDADWICNHMKAAKFGNLQLVLDDVLPD